MSISRKSGAADFNAATSLLPVMSVDFAAAAAFAILK